MKISVVLGSYNGQKYIEEQLESIRTQTRPADEVLIFDDCSTDATVEIVNQYIKKYDLKSWKLQVNTSNKGFAQNFYDGISMTTGDFVFTADQDDIWSKDKLEKMVGIMEKEAEINILCGGFKPLFEENIDFASKMFWEIQQFFSHYNGKVKAKTFEKKGVYAGSHGWTLEIRKSFFDKIKEAWSADYYSHDGFLCIYAALESSIYEYQYVTGLFRKHRESTTAYQAGGKNSKIQKEISIDNIYLRRIGDVLNYLDIHDKIKNKSAKRKTALKQKAYYETRNKFYEHRNIGNFSKLLRYSRTINKAWLLKDLLFAIRG